MKWKHDPSSNATFVCVNIFWTSFFPRCSQILYSISTLSRIPSRKFSLPSSFLWVFYAICKRKYINKMLIKLSQTGQHFGDTLPIANLIIQVFSKMSNNQRNYEINWNNFSLRCAFKNMTSAGLAASHWSLRSIKSIKPFRYMFYSC